MSKTLNIYAIVSVVLLAFSTLAHSASPVWKVSKGDKFIYLGGTIHLLSSSDYPLPAPFDTAYKNSDSLVLETDIRVMQTPAYMLKLQQAMTFSNGQTLNSVLKPKTFEALSAYFDKRSLPKDNFMVYTPTGVALTISLLEMQRLGMRPESGVDQFYALMAQNDNKSLTGLETPDEHIAFLSMLEDGNADQLIMKTLNDVEKMPTMLSEMKTAWREGDNKKLEALASRDIKRDFPKIYQRLLTDRNNAWLPKIETMLKDAPVEMVLVGAMHLAGKDGLVYQLKKRGYTLENL